METVRCDLCGSDKSSVLFSQKDLLHKFVDKSFNVVRCQDCGLCYLNPRPEKDEIIRYYPDEGYSFWAPSNGLKAKMRSLLRKAIFNAYFCESSVPVCGAIARIAIFPLTLIPKGRKIINGNIMPRIKSYMEGVIPGRMLDIGCGSGEDLHIFDYSESLVNLAKKGWEAYGIEISDRARHILGLHGSVKCYKDLFDAVFRDGFFDCVRMNWSLEHCHSPMEYLRECKRILKPGSKLIISIPNYDGITYKIFPQCVEVPLHLYHFTVDTFKKYAEKAGLNIVNYYTFSRVALFATALQMMGHDSVAEGILLDVRRGRRIQEFLNVVSSLGYGDDMVFCLTKSMED